MWSSAAITLLATLALVAACGGGDTIEGVVDHKAVTGVKEETSYTILQNRLRSSGGSIVLRDADYQQFFSDEDRNAVISEALENALRAEYSDITYLVNVRTELVTDGTQPYRVTRQLFNQMEVGSTVRFQTSGGGPIPTIRKLRR